MMGELLNEFDWFTLFEFGSFSDAFREFIIDLREMCLDGFFFLSHKLSWLSFDDDLNVTLAVLVFLVGLSFINEKEEI